MWLYLCVLPVRADSKKVLHSVCFSNEPGSRALSIPIPRKYRRAHTMCHSNTYTAQWLDSFESYFSRTCLAVLQLLAHKYTRTHERVSVCLNVCDGIILLRVLGSAHACVGARRLAEAPSADRSAYVRAETDDSAACVCVYVCACGERDPSIRRNETATKLG